VAPLLQLEEEEEEEWGQQANGGARLDKVSHDLVVYLSICLSIDLETLVLKSSQVKSSRASSTVIVGQ